MNKVMIISFKILYNYYYFSKKNELFMDSNFNDEDNDLKEYYLNKNIIQRNIFLFFFSIDLH